MPIPIEQEDPSLTRMFGRCLEHCCFCFAPTPFWHTRKDVAVCEECAPVHDPRDVPSKPEWCDAVAAHLAAAETSSLRMPSHIEHLG